MNLQSSTLPVRPDRHFVSAHCPPAIEAVELRHLKTADEIERILHLREGIDLSALSSVEPDFRTREKKETSGVSSSVSNSTATP
jgi:hypothetical protein